MLNTVLLLLAVTAIIVYEIPKMQNQKSKKEITMFSTLLGFATVLYILQVLGIEIPNPLESLRAIFSPIGLAIDSFWKK